MRRFLIIAIMALMFGLLASGCAKKAMVSGPEGPAEGAMVEEMVQEEGMMGEKMGEEEIAKMDMRERAEAEGREMAAGEMAAIKDIYFDFDKFNIKQDQQPALKAVAAELKGNNKKVLIEGHCDERGTNEYNLALGDRRASSTKEFLEALGVSPSRIETVSYGEEKPQCMESAESCWWKNRRAHFVILSK